MGLAERGSGVARPNPRSKGLTAAELTSDAFAGRNRGGDVFALGARKWEVLTRFDELSDHSTPNCLSEVGRLGTGCSKVKLLSSIGRGDWVVEFGDQTFSSGDSKRLRQWFRMLASLYGPQLPLLVSKR
jgi:hypothetical protein